MSSWSTGALFLTGVAVAGWAARWTNLPSDQSGLSSYNCLGSVYTLLESVAVFASPVQWMVAFLGLCLYPAISRSGRTGAIICSASPSVQESPSRPSGPGSHSIQLDPYPPQPRGAGAGFLKRLRRVLSDGRAQARRLCGRDSLQNAVSSFSRKRSFGSGRSSKSEDVLSSRLSTDSTRATQQSVGGGGFRHGLLRRAQGDGGSRWRPSMCRIASGQHLAGLAPSESSLSSATGGKRLEILSYNGFQAVDCLSHELTDPAFQSVIQVVTDTHLLQFGALIGEASAQLALSQAGSSGAVGPAPASLFGLYDRKDLYGQGWELILEEHKPGLHYWNWRRPLRKGLYMYKSKTVYEAATTAQIVGFTYDMEFRKTWDESVTCQVPIPPPPAAAAGSGGAATMSMAEADAKGAGGRSAFMYARTKFPPPMASRDYVYARRCWAKPDDGGCYCVSRSCAHPAPPAAGGRAVRVEDFVSGYVIRSSKGVYDAASPAVEIISVYFEDAGVPAGIANMSVRRALWPMVQKSEVAFRDYLLTRVHGSLAQPPPERPVALDSLGAAMGAGAAQAAARAAAAAVDADAASCVGALPYGWGLRLKLGSPFALYSAYMAACRGGRAASLAALSCCMSLWCNATGAFVGALALARAGLRAAAAASKAALAAASRQLAASRTAVLAAIKQHGASNAGGKARLLARMLWPWEAVMCRGSSASASSSSLQRSTSGGSSRISASGSRLSSHPLPGGCDAPGPKRVSFAPRVSNGGSGAGEDGQPPRSGGRRVRGNLARRCALVAVKVAKLAGAGLLLGRAARAEGTAAQEAAAAGYAGQVAANAPQQAQQQQQQQRKRPVW